MTTYNFYSMVADFTTAGGAKRSILFHVQETTKQGAKMAVERYIDKAEELGPALHGVIINDYVDGVSYYDYSRVILTDGNEAAMQYRLEQDRLKSLLARVQETEAAMKVIETGIWDSMMKAGKDYAVIGGLIWKANSIDSENYVAKPVGEV